MKQTIMIAGPFGELQGVLHLCDVEENRDKVLVMAHGFRGSMDGGGRAAQLADEVCKSICSVVRFNFTRCTMLSNQVAELKCALDYVRNTLQPKKLFLLGRSFGGATCIITACEDIEIAREEADILAIGKDNNPAASWFARKTYRPDGMVLWSAPNSLKRTFVQVLGEKAFQAAMQGKTIVMDDERGHDEIPAAFVTDLLKYNIGALLKHWENGPLLIIHGEKDCIVSPDQAKENFDLAGGDKQLHYMEGDNHHLDLRFQEAGNLIKRWLKDNI